MVWLRKPYFLVTGGRTLIKMLIYLFHVFTYIFLLLVQSDTGSLHVMRKRVNLKTPYNQFFLLSPFPLIKCHEGDIKVKEKIDKIMNPMKRLAISFGSFFASDISMKFFPARASWSLIVKVFNMCDIHWHFVLKSSRSCVLLYFSYSATHAEQVFLVSI